MRKADVAASPTPAVAGRQQIDDLHIVRHPHMRGGQVVVTVAPMVVGNAWQEAA